MVAQLEAEYAAVGLGLSSLGEAPDHAAVELEFVSFLCSQEAVAWETQNLPEVLEAINRQRSFLEEHPYWWFPALARSVAKKDSHGLYSMITQTAWSLVSHDADFLIALASRMRVGRRTG